MITCAHLLIRPLFCLSLYSRQSLQPFFLLFALTPITSGAIVSFSRDIRPILSANCYKCHGPDDGKNDKGKSLRKAGLRLDVEDSQDWDDVIDRITSTDPEDIMPPRLSA